MSSSKKKDQKSSSGGRKKSGKENDYSVKLKEFLKTYEAKCLQGRWKVDIHLKDQIKSSISEDKLVTKFVVTSSSEGTSIIPLIQTLRTCWYKQIRELYIYKLSILYEQIVVLSNFLEQESYQLDYLEMFDCKVDAYSLKRLGLQKNKSLRSLVLDHTKLGEEGLSAIEESLACTTTLLKLSLCYCELEKQCGKRLANIITNSSIAELYLDGNMLECEGLFHVIEILADKAEYEKEQDEIAKHDDAVDTAVNIHGAATSIDDEETKIIRSLDRVNQPSESVNETNDMKVKQPTKKKKKKLSKQLISQSPPKVGTFLKILHVANNGIDQMTSNNAQYTPYDVMQVMKRWIASDKDIVEINIEDNLITELGAREILLGLEQRKTDGLTALNMKVTHRVSATLFKQILTLASGQKKSRKSKKKKKNSGKRRV